MKRTRIVTTDAIRADMHKIATLADCTMPQAYGATVGLALDVLDEGKIVEHVKEAVAIWRAKESEADNDE